MRLVDELDLNMLIKAKEVSSRPPINYVDLSRLLGVSEWTIRHRLRRMENVGVIKGYDILIDPTKLGYDSFFSTGIQVQPRVIEEVAVKLANHPHVYQLVLETGAHDIHLEAMFQNTKQRVDFIERLRRIEGVLSFHASEIVKWVVGMPCVRPETLIAVRDRLRLGFND